MGFITDFIKRHRSMRRCRSFRATQGAVDIFGANTGDMSIATVYRCVQILSESVAQLRFQPRRLCEGVMQADRSSREAFLLTVSPNEQMSAFTFWRYVVQDLLLNGNAYILPQYSATLPQIEGLERIIPTCFTPDIQRGIYTIFDGEHLIASVPSSEILHIAGMPSRRTYDKQ